MALKPFNDDITIQGNKQQKCIKQIADISGEEGSKRAYGPTNSLYQHYNKLFIAATKDFTQDHIDD